MKAFQLIAHLEAGGILIQQEYADSLNTIKYLRICDVHFPHAYLWNGGWGSAMETPKDLLWDIVMHPETWHILPLGDYDTYKAILLAAKEYFQCITATNS